MNCECGGTLEESTLATYDFSPLVGFAVELQHVPGLRCTKCHRTLLDGHVINLVLQLLMVAVTTQPGRLQRVQAKFLRKRLRMSQQALADRMNVARETVAKWECGDSEISPHHDFILRAVVIGCVLGETSQPLDREAISEALREVHRETPLTTPSPFLMDLTHQHFERQATA